MSAPRKRPGQATDTDIVVAMRRTPSFTTDQIWTAFRDATRELSLADAAAGQSVTFIVGEHEAHIDTYDEDDSHSRHPDVYLSGLFHNVMHAAIQAGVKINEPDLRLFRSIMRVLGLSLWDAEEYVLYLRDGDVTVEARRVKATIDPSLDKTLYLLVADLQEVPLREAKSDVRALRAAGVTLGLAADWVCPEWMTV